MGFSRNSHCIRVFLASSLHLPIVLHSILLILFLLLPNCAECDSPISGFSAKVTASDAAADDRFGTGVAIEGDTAAVGAHWNDDGGSQSGAVYIFERDQGGANAWGELKKITTGDAASGDVFGYSVSLSGDTLAASAHGDNPGGAVYIFQRNVGGSNNWGEVRKIIAGDSGSYDSFGYRVQLKGDTLVAGAPQDDDSGTDSGSAYIFKRNQGGTNNWGLVKKLLPSDGNAGDYFGLVAISASEQRIVVGSIWDDDYGSNSGSAYVYDVNEGGTGNWGLVKKIHAVDASADDEFGHGIVVQGDLVAVGAPLHSIVDSNCEHGATYIFSKDSGGANNWGQTKKICPSDGESDIGFGFGAYLAMDPASQLLLAARIGGFNHITNTRPGSIYVFARDLGGSGNWGEQGSLSSCDGDWSDAFASYSFDISGSDCIAGIPQDDDDGTDSGSAFIFDFTQQLGNICTPDSCVGDIVLQNTVIYSGESRIHETAGKISNLNNSYVIKNGGQVDLIAKSSIRLTSNFRVEIGGELRVIIDPNACS